MKKHFAMLLAVIMLLATTMPVCAATPATPKNGTGETERQLVSCASAKISQTKAASSKTADRSVSNRKALEKKARQAGDALQKFAKQNGWTVTRSKKGKRSDERRAYETLSFGNKKYRWDARVIAERKNGKIVIRYTKAGHPSTAKDIKGWLVMFRDVIVFN